MAIGIDHEAHLHMDVYMVDRNDCSERKREMKMANISSRKNQTRKLTSHSFSLNERTNIFDCEIKVQFTLIYMILGGVRAKVVILFLSGLFDSFETNSSLFLMG